MTWRFLDTGLHSGTFNMEFDETLAQQLNAGDCPPTLRVYGWHPAAISIGRNQNMADFDQAKLSSEGIDLVRRPTGGRAILHADELTYCAVLPVQGRSLREIYRLLNEGILSALLMLGIDAKLSSDEPSFRQLYADSASIPCFSSTAKCEIQFEGKKLVGSAQRRLGTTVLQHGSLLLGPGHRCILDFLAPHVDRARTAMEEHLLECTTDVQAILGRTVSFGEAAMCMKKGFETACGITFTESEVSLEEIEH